MFTAHHYCYIIFITCYQYGREHFDNMNSAPLSRANDKRRNNSVFSMFGMMSLNSWLDIQIDFQKNLILGRRKSCIIIKLKSRETPKAIKQLPI